jgi:Bacterial PH domain/Short C-terminal domain
LGLEQRERGMEAKGSEGSVKLLADSLLLEFGGLQPSKTKKQASPVSLALSELVGVEIYKGSTFKPHGVRFQIAGDAVQDPRHDPRTMGFIDRKHGVILGHLVAEVAARTGIPVTGDLAELAVPAPTAEHLEAEKRSQELERQAQLAEKQAHRAENQAEKQTKKTEKLDKKAEALRAAGIREDIIEARGKMKGARIGSGGEIKRLATHLLADEHVDLIGNGTYDGDLGIVALTSHRVLFLYDSLTRKRLEDFSIDRITSVQTEHELVQGSLIIFAAGNRAKISKIYNDDLKAIANEIRRRLNTSTTPEPAAVAPAEDPIEQIKRLGELRDAGLVSSDEFEAKKEELLSRL